MLNAETYAQVLHHSHYLESALLRPQIPKSLAAHLTDYHFLAQTLDPKIKTLGRKANLEVEQSGHNYPDIPGIL